MSVGDNIRQARKAASVTQEELGARLNIGKSSVCEWEAGKRSVPIDLLDSIAAALDTTVPFLMGWDPSQFIADGALRSLSSSALDFAHKYDALDSHGQKVISALLNLEFDRCQESSTELSVDQQYALAAQRFASYSEDSPSDEATPRAAKS